MRVHEYVRLVKAHALVTGGGSTTPYLRHIELSKCLAEMTQHQFEMLHGEALVNHVGVHES